MPKTRNPKELLRRLATSCICMPHESRSVAERPAWRAVTCEQVRFWSPVVWCGWRWRVARCERRHCLCHDGLTGTHRPPWRRNDREDGNGPSSTVVAGRGRGGRSSVPSHTQLASFSSYIRPSSVVRRPSSLSSFSSWPSVQDQPKHSRPPLPYLHATPYRLPAFNSLVLTHKINEVQTDAVLLLVDTLFANSSSSAAVSGLAPVSASS